MKAYQVRVVKTSGSFILKLDKWSGQVLINELLNE